MRNKIFAKRGYLVGIVSLLTVVFLLGAVVPAFSLVTTDKKSIMFRLIHPPMNCEGANGLVVTATAQNNNNSGMSPWQNKLVNTPNPNNNVSPFTTGNHATNALGWMLSPAPTSWFTTGSYVTNIKFGPSNNYMSCNSYSTTYANNGFYVKYDFIPPGAFPTIGRQINLTYNWIDQSSNYLPTCGILNLGWEWDPNPKPRNPDTHSNDMVIKNLRFAASPTKLTEEELSLDNPVVQNLFSSSLDPLRPGPIVIAPGNTYDPSIDPSVTESQPVGSTIIAKGTVDDSNGMPSPFLVQFTEEEETPPEPVGYNPQWLIISLISLTLVGGYLLRRRSLNN